MKFDVPSPEFTVLRLLGHGRITADEAREYLVLIQGGESPDLPNDQLSPRGRFPMIDGELRYSVADLRVDLEGEPDGDIVVIDTSLVTEHGDHSIYKTVSSGKGVLWLNLGGRYNVQKHYDAPT